MAANCLVTTLGGENMAKYNGKELRKAELLQSVGSMDQIASIQAKAYTDGKAAGVRTLEFDNGSGLFFEVLVDRCLDLGNVRYHGQALNWQSAVGVVHPSYYDAHETRWLRTFGGGFLATCGLTAAGAATVDQGQSIGMHGRIGNTPAELVSHGGAWQGDEYILQCQGQVRETEVFGANLTMQRRIWTRLGETAFWVEDLVTNTGYQTTPHMMLYHINLGFPLLGPDARLETPAAQVVPRDAIAAPGLDEYDVFSGPVPNYQEQVFYHEMEDGEDWVTVKVHNPTLAGWSGMALRYQKSELPKFIEWKMVSQGEYVLGLEPANCLVEGRDKEREQGTLQFLEPGESRSYKFQVQILI